MNIFSNLVAQRHKLILQLLAVTLIAFLLPVQARHLSTSRITDLLSTSEERLNQQESRLKRISSIPEPPKFEAPTITKVEKIKAVKDERRGKVLQVRQPSWHEESSSISEPVVEEPSIEEPQIVEPELVKPVEPIVETPTIASRPAEPEPEPEPAMDLVQKIYQHVIPQPQPEQQVTAVEEEAEEEIDLQEVIENEPTRVEEPVVEEIVEENVEETIEEVSQEIEAKEENVLELVEEEGIEEILEQEGDNQEEMEFIAEEGKNLQSVTRKVLNKNFDDSKYLSLIKNAFESLETDSWNIAKQNMQDIIKFFFEEKEKFHNIELIDAYMNVARSFLFFCEASIELDKGYTSDFDKAEQQYIQASEFLFNAANMIDGQPRESFKELRSIIDKTLAYIDEELVYIESVVGDE